MLIYKDNIFIDPAINNRQELFDLFNKKLFKKGFVKKGFYRALIERERSYPTGLCVENINIALPHTNPDMVIRETVAVATVKSPVSFGKMGDPDSTIGVNIIFLLLIKNKKAKFYHNLLNKIKNSDILHKIYESDNSQALCLLLIKLLNT